MSDRKPNPLNLSDDCLALLAKDQFWKGVTLFCDERERSIVGSLKTCTAEALPKLQGGIAELNVLRRLRGAVDEFVNSLEKPIDK